MLTFLIVVYLTIVNAQISITPVQDSVPMIFNKLAAAHTTYEDVKLIYYVDLKNYFELKNTASRAIDIADKLCDQTKNIRECNIVITQLHFQQKIAKRNENEIRAQRQRRALCEWCGTIQYYLYGTMDATRAREYAERINLIADETKKQNGILQNQTIFLQRFLKTNDEAIRNVEVELNRLQTEMNAAINDLQVKDRELENLLTIHLLIQIASTVLNEHSEMHFQISRAIYDARNHRIPEFIPIDQIKNDLKKLSSTLGVNQQLPILTTDENPMHIIKMAEVTSILVDEILITEVIIPIVEREPFWLYKVTPIPMKTPGGHIIANPQNSYFLINNDQTKYIPISEGEMRHGMLIAPNKMIYKPSAATQLKMESVCVWRLLAEGSVDSALNLCNFSPLVTNDMILTILDNESYFMSLSKSTKIWEICNDQQTENHEIIGKFIINIKNGCSIKAASFMIRPHKTHIFNKTQIYAPQLTMNDTSMIQMNRMTGTKTMELNSNHHEPIFIQNRQEMQHLIDESDTLINAARHEFNPEDLKYEPNIFSWEFLSQIKYILLIPLILCLLAAFCRFGMMQMIMGIICKRAEQAVESHVVQFVERDESNAIKYPKTPRPQRDQQVIQIEDN